MEAVKRVIRGTDKLINYTTGLVLALVLLYGGYALWDTIKVYNRAGISSEIMHFKPTVDDASNPSLSELQAINPDVCAWLTVEDTNIDYPVLQGKNNKEYLNRDFYGEYSLGGSVFLDCQNSREFTDPYLLIYGHHMEGGAMFGDITNFSEETYFNEHQTGWLFIPGKSYKLEIYAYLHVDAYASPMFDVELDLEEFAERLTYIMNTATHYRETGVMADDQIVALSTCSSATTNGRSIVVAKLVEYTDAGGDEIK